MSRYIKVLRQFNRDVWLNLTVWALLTFAYFGVLGVLFNLYLLRLGYGPSFIGLLIGVGQLVWALCALPASIVGARLGTRTTLILGLILVTGAWIALLLAEALPSPLLTAGLFASWMMSWGGAALFTVNATPFLMSLTTPVTRNHAFAMQGATTSLFALLGSLVGGLLPGWWATQLGATLDQPSPYRAGLWIMPLTCGLAVLVLLLTRRAQVAGSVTISVAAPPPICERSRRGLLIFVGLLVLLEMLGEGVVRSFFNIYLDAGLHLPTAQIGVLFSVAQVLPIAVALITPVITTRLGKVATLGVAMVGIALGLLLLALSAGVILAGVGYLGILIMGAMLSPTLTVFSQEAATEEQRATVAAIVTMGLALGSSLASLAGGYVIATLGFPMLFLGGMVAVLLAVGLLLGYGGVRYTKPFPSLT